jgi:hypothetical protein
MLLAEEDAATEPIDTAVGYVEQVNDIPVVTLNEMVAVHEAFALLIISNTLARSTATTEAIKRFFFIVITIKR